MVKGDRRRGPLPSVVRTASAMAWKPPTPEAMTVAVRSCASALCGALRRPAGLRQGLLRGGQGEEDEAVHLALFLGGQQQVGIEAGLRVPGTVGDLAADADGQVADQLRRELGDARLPGQQALPYGFDSAAQRADRAHAGDDDTFAHEGPSPSVPLE